MSEAKNILKKSAGIHHLMQVQGETRKQGTVTVNAALDLPLPKNLSQFLFSDLLFLRITPY